MKQPTEWEAIPTIIPTTEQSVPGVTIKLADEITGDTFLTVETTLEFIGKLAEAAAQASRDTATVA